MPSKTAVDARWIFGEINICKFGKLCSLWGTIKAMLYNLFGVKILHRIQGRSRGEFEDSPATPGPDAPVAASSVDGPLGLCFEAQILCGGWTARLCKCQNKKGSVDFPKIQ